MQIAVYTIALNEIDHCVRWANSVIDADYRIVLDTGSTDGTVEALRELGVTVYEKKYSNWRFDVARNDALNLIPNIADVCISMDMDEFMAPSWRNEIEKTWTSNTTKLGYSYVFNYDSKLTKQNSYYADKIHSRFGYEWRRPVHETIFPINDMPQIISNNLNVVMNQIQDTNKSTRNNYLNLLELAYRENPLDAQIAFWLGREYMYRENSESAIYVLQKFLELPDIWHIEASEALLYLSKLDVTKRLEYLLRASVKSPNRREVWLELAHYYYTNSDWSGLLWSAMNGLEKSIRYDSYLDKTDSWDNRLYDFASLAAWNLGWRDKAIQYCELAHLMNPSDLRLQNNLNLMRN